jgi:hypothetical protein
MSEKAYKRFPGNAPGPFYVEDNICMHCGAPEAAAPDLMDFDEEARSCYFKKQPSTPEEYEQAMQAVWVSCCEAVHYATDDPLVLERIQELQEAEGRRRIKLFQIRRARRAEERRERQLLNAEATESQAKPWWKFW